MLLSLFFIGTFVLTFFLDDEDLMNEKILLQLEDGSYIVSNPQQFFSGKAGAILLIVFQIILIIGFLASALFLCQSTSLSNVQLVRKIPQVLEYDEPDESSEEL
jgi:hypothetical protein